MKGVKERLAYLRGLAEGLNVGQNSPEGRVLVEMMDVLQAMSRSLDNLELTQAHLEEYIEAVDDDLTDLENEFYDEYDEDLDELLLDDEDEYDEDLDLDCYDEDEDTAIAYIEVNCPNCGETVFVDEDVFDGDEVVEVLCPECNETVLVNDEYENTELVSD
ncbi:CD1247 N-terminal domain-containing protein [Tumebacillus flagellatus]|uniref:AraC family transcriptional regulator n=1 Tax=Tumebacillus flagellatus TaxID=1157490 RepID=A0A074LNI6_9BACL|nr:CD1247 N-terminal domain-containing protein [Tumebacillus flagellatus]KEO82639.1 hypothetical protein EL26_13810 [Tumebacillus flagellatus]